MKREFSRKNAQQRRVTRRLVTAAAAGLASSAGGALADTSTTLIGVTPSTANTDVPSNHGSNAEVTLSWTDAWDQYDNWDGRGDVYQVDQLLVELGFTPAASNIAVTISSFELDEWAGGGATVAAWRVDGSVSGLIASGTWTDFVAADGGRSLVAANATGAAGEQLTLSIDHSGGGTVSYLAMDNLVFSTKVVPEPATAAMAWSAVAGLGALAMRRRRG